MDPQPLVDLQLDAGEWLLASLAARGVPVRYAYWGRPVNRDRWTLKIATPLVDELGLTTAYGVVLDALRAFDELARTDSAVTLVRPDDRTAASLEQDRRLMPGTPICEALAGPGGGEYVGYVYPPADPALAHTGLTTEQKQLLTDLYVLTPLSVDDLPYTDDMTRLHEWFVSQTGSPVTIHDLYKALKSLGRQGRLAGKRRAAGGPGRPVLAAG